MADIELGPLGKDGARIVERGENEDGNIVQRPRKRKRTFCFCASPVGRACFWLCGFEGSATASMR